MQNGFTASLALAGVLCLVAVQPAAAQKTNRNNNSKQDEKRENQKVADAQRQVKDNQADVNAAQQKLREVMRSTGKLQAAVVEARNRWRGQREATEDKLARALGIEAAQARLKEAKDKLSEATKPILDKLRQSPDWLAAKQAAEEARRTAERVREDVELSDDQQNSKIDELVKIIGRPEELEKRAILASPQGQPLTDKVNAALAEIAKIRQAVDDNQVDADPAVVQAKRAVDQAETELKKNQQKVASERGAVQKAQNQLTQSRQKLQQAQAADAKDKNRK